MPTPEPVEIAAPPLALHQCTVAEHARALVEARVLPFWWYQGTSRVLGNYSIPFADGEGTWWYQVKPGLCWPVDFLRTLRADHPGPQYRKSYLGYQHLVPGQQGANSTLVINSIPDLGAYGAARVGRSRRKLIRRGLRDCDVGVLAGFDRATFDQCREAWNDLSRRTGWKRPMSQRAFDASWRLLLELPGASIIVARDRASGTVAGFRITKIIGDTAYGDTTASATSLLESNVNSAMTYAFLASAATLPGIAKAHLAIRSRVTSLEAYKRSFGFDHHAYPARTAFRIGVEPALKLVARDSYDRMTGRFADLR